MFAGAINLIIVPLDLYNGGFVGIAQIVRTVMERYLEIDFGGIDLAGIVYYVLNVPLFAMAFKHMNKGFFYKSIFVVTTQTILLTLIPAPAVPFLTDVLTACIVGGVIAGAGAGLILRSGAAGGGQDILGVYFSKMKPSYSVGKLSIIINLFVYLVCGMLFDLTIVIYSLIYTIVLSFAIDKVHSQNINTFVMIFTKKPGLEKQIIEKINRGATVWSGYGGYTGDDTNIVVTVLSKYEIPELRKAVTEYDENAFVVVNNLMDITGNYEKKLDF